MRKLGLKGRPWFHGFCLSALPRMIVQKRTTTVPCSCVDAHPLPSLNTTGTPMQLTGKIALVTGGTRGIGAATALALAKRRRRRRDRRPAPRRRARATRAALLALGRRCEVIHADCAQPSECIRCVKETETKLGPVTVLVPLRRRAGERRLVRGSRRSVERRVRRPRPRRVPSQPRGHSDDAHEEGRRDRAGLIVAGIRA